MDMVWGRFSLKYQMLANQPQIIKEYCTLVREFDVYMTNFDTREDDIGRYSFVFDILYIQQM